MRIGFGKTGPYSKFQEGGINKSNKKQQSIPRGPQKGNPVMTTSTVTARRKGYPHHMLREWILCVERPRVGDTPKCYYLLSAKTNLFVHQLEQSLDLFLRHASKQMERRVKSLNMKKKLSCRIAFSLKLGYLQCRLLLRMSAGRPNMY